MLDLSWSHIVILLIVALVVVGPKDLPRLMRIIGQWTGKARAMANEFRKSFDDMARQAELDELRKEIEQLKHNNPLNDVAKELNKSIIPDDLKSQPLMKAKEPPAVSLEPEPVASETAAAIPVEIETAPHIDDPAIPEPPEPVAADGYVPPRP
ncbi:MAG: twin-arginine translocase subunit TatB [Alphaproteobacteria bacterium]|nr:twin-arginine translocase subunit TatB [Alphaproteobacteria bacterium]MBL6939928.1 twin-arginine translocase subunit TatB [Alphaproteobacteria bacterium]MBL7099846.1 twin-arginine translocase subunit TatB [Alphaproteobacteria bacterium]